MFWQHNGSLQHLHHHVVLLAVWTLAQRMQYLVPASPLLDHTNFCAAPSASTIWKSRYMVMSPLGSPFGPFSLKPSLGSTIVEQKMEWSTWLIIWAMPPSSVVTNVDLSTLM